MKYQVKDYYVKELADYYGISAQAVRLYDKKGLLPSDKNEVNGYRTYTREDVVTMDYICRLKKMHFSLEEIRRIRAEGVDREIFTLCKNEKYGQLIENLENVEDSASQMADFALSGQTVAQQISMLAGLTAEDADAALQHILCTDRMATMYILPDGTAQAAEEDEEEEE